MWKLSMLINRELSPNFTVVQMKASDVKGLSLVLVLCWSLLLQTNGN